MESGHRGQVLHRDTELDAVLLQDVPEAGALVPGAADVHRSDEAHAWPEIITSEAGHEVSLVRRGQPEAEDLISRVEAGGPSQAEAGENRQH